jgi:hypothetical protein
MGAAAIDHRGHGARFRKEAERLEDAYDAAVHCARVLLARVIKVVVLVQIAVSACSHHDRIARAGILHGLADGSAGGGIVAAHRTVASGIRHPLSGSEGTLCEAESGEWDEAQDEAPGTCESK